MGVLFDYYRAADALAARQPGPDVLAAEGLDPAVGLGQLLALILDRPWEPDLVGSRLVWPTGPAPEEYDENSPWSTGPWIEELSAAVRDTLAGVPDSSFPTLADGWHRTEELAGHTVSTAQALIADFVGLARRAQEAGDRLYCVMSL